jgi:hypothetical protein
MLPEPWVLAVAVGLDLLFAFVAYRTARAAHASGGRDTEAYVDTGAGTVTCPDCGAENDLGDRFCRRCVEELPRSTMPFERSVERTDAVT